MDNALWRLVNDEHEPCYRCEEWSRLGLSSTCPTCDQSILDRYDELMAERRDGQYVATLVLALADEMRNSKTVG